LDFLGFLKRFFCKNLKKPRFLQPLSTALALSIAYDVISEKENEDKRRRGGGGNGLGRKPQTQNPSCVSGLHLAINRSHLASFFCVSGQTVNLIPPICDFIRHRPTRRMSSHADAVLGHAVKRTGVNLRKSCRVSAEK